MIDLFVLHTICHKKKTLVSAHVVPDSFIGSLIFSELWRPLAKQYLKLVYNRSKMVIAVSPTVKKELEKIGVKSRIEVLCNSVNRSRFKPDSELKSKYRKKFGISDDAFVVSCVGQIQPRKGVLEFIETARQCPEATFVWIGGRPFGRLTADYANMTKAVDEAPENVKFIGVVDFDDMPGCYAMSDVYFLPSLQENFAFATIEASAVKLPLLLRDNPEYPDSLFTHYLKGKTPEEYAKAIQTLQSSKSDYETWANESDVLAEKYTLRQYMETLVGYYKEVHSGQ